MPGFSGSTWGHKRISYSSTYHVKLSDKKLSTLYRYANRIIINESKIN